MRHRAHLRPCPTATPTASALAAPTAVPRPFAWVGRTAIAVATPTSPAGVAARLVPHGAC
eukprot:m.1428849 g.1428849  ORF g.1428849 m.1428849 type:complete len:60 (+) comp25068_c0_seq3:3709-3888(+)